MPWAAPLVARGHCSSPLGSPVSSSVGRPCTDSEPQSWVCTRPGEGAPRGGAQSTQRKAASEHEGKRKGGSPAGGLRL